MPDRTISYLSIGCGALLATYIVLVITTVSFAAWQTGLAASVRATETAIAELESEYYVAIEDVSALQPSAFGLVPPSEVRYATKVAAPGLTRR